MQALKTPRHLMKARLPEPVYLKSSKSETRLQKPGHLALPYLPLPEPLKT
jgi:hypothetical protein